MRKCKFTESQIVGNLGEGEAGLHVAEVCRKHGISVPTYYQWKSKYSGVSVSELKRIKDLEAENSRLKRMYAELALENTAIKDLSKGTDLSGFSQSNWMRLPMTSTTDHARDWEYNRSCRFIESCS